MSNPIILVTGANGQLGSEIRVLAHTTSGFDFIFLSRQELAIENTADVDKYFASHSPRYVLNCAAYTAVDKAEKEQEEAYSINGQAAGILAAACKNSGAGFIHISTDYVFNGLGTRPYREDDAVDPVNTYGDSKLQGERAAFANNAESIVIRTSWVYSEFGNNFVKTMIRLMKEKDSLGVVSDQMGSPTYAADLAAAILAIVASDKWVAGIYHYSNEGIISWYEFAVAIKQYVPGDCIVRPISTESYPTPAKRPGYSAFSKEKIKNYFNVAVPAWEKSLATCMDRLNQV